MNLRLLMMLPVAVLWVSAARGQGVASEPYTWKSVKIVAGGFITGIVFSSKEPGLIYARTDIGGAYRFDASARQWIPLTDWIGPQNGNLGGCESLAPDPQDSNKIYLALGNYSRGPAAIARSTDRGQTFKLTPVPFAMGANENGRGMGERLAVDPSNTRILYFGSRRDGLWTSTDSAATWGHVDGFPIAASASAGVRGQVQSGAAGIAWIIFDPPRESRTGQATQHLFAGVASGARASIYESTDAGKSWRPVADAPQKLMPHHAAIDPVSHTLYVTYNNGPGPNDITAGSLWKFQIDQGRWTNITPPPNEPPRAGGYSAIALDPQHPGTLLLSTVDQWSLPDDLFRSTDDGRTWKRIAATARLDPALSPYLHWGEAPSTRPRFGWWLAAVAVDPFDSNHALFGTGATIWGTHNLTDMEAPNPQTSWTVAAEGIEETAVLALISPPQGPHLISGVGDIGGFTHDDFTVSPAGGMHTNPLFTNTTSLDFAEQKPAVIVRTGTASRGGGTAAISEDSGKTWHPVTLPGAPGNAAGGAGNNSGAYLVLSADAAVLLCANGAGTFISKDKGAAWTESAGLFSGARPVADRVEPKTFYALDASNRKIYASIDGGATFTGTDVTGLPDNTARRSGFATVSVRFKVSSFKSASLYALLAGTLYHSENGGRSFAAISSGAAITNFTFGAPPPNVAASHPSIFVSATINNVASLYRSDNHGAAWLRINDDQHQFGGQPTVLAADPRVYGRLYIGMNGRGILYGEPQAR